MESFRFAKQVVTAPENEDNFVSSFPILITFFFFYFVFSALASTSTIMLNKSREGHLVLSLIKRKISLYHL